MLLGIPLSRCLVFVPFKLLGMVIATPSSIKAGSHYTQVNVLRCETHKTQRNALTCVYCEPALTLGGMKSGCMFCQTYMHTADVFSDTRHGFETSKLETTKPALNNLGIHKNNFEP